MKNNELGFESLYMHGMGGASIDDHPRSISVEAYDGFEDAASIELAHAMESLDFMGTYEAINSKITADKIRMCKRLAVNYGKNSSLLNKQAANSIESLCLQHSLEAENNAVTSSTDIKTDKKPGTDKTAKKEGFFKRMVKILKDVFDKIVGFFKMIFENVSKFIRNLFKKKPAEDVNVKDIEEAVAAKVSNGPSEELLGSKILIVGGNLNFNAASNKIVKETENLTKMLTGHGGGGKDLDKFKQFAADINKQTGVVLSAFGVSLTKDKTWHKGQSDEKTYTVTDLSGLDKYEKESIQKVFGVKVAEASDKAGMKAAMNWASKGENVNDAGDSLEKVINDAADKINRCAKKCSEYAGQLDKRYDAATGDVEVIGKTMVSGLRNVAKVQNSYGKLLLRLSKAVAASYKMNSLGSSKNKKKKEHKEMIAAANKRSPNATRGKTYDEKMKNAGLM